jgi:hypothetical protein
MTSYALTVTIVAGFGGSTAFGARDTRGYARLRPVIKPATVAISAQASPGDLVIKFREGLAVDSKSSRLGGPDARRVVDLFASKGLNPPTPSVSGDVETIRGQRLTGEDRVKMILPDLSLYFREPINDAALANELIHELNALDEVETAYFEPRPEPATFKSTATAEPSAILSTSTTPNFEGGQLYLNAAPGGVDARAAWTLPGGASAGVKITDVEYGWQLTHEDLSAGQTATVIGINQTNDTDHGTAVLGEMVSDRNGYGMTGIAHDAHIGVASVLTLSVSGAINQAVASSEPGDAILIELHSPGPRFDTLRDDQRGYIAMEYWQDVFDAILNAWAHGVIVCEAAGNGAEDFDDPLYGGAFDPAVRYSHAIICGAGNPPSTTANDRSKLNFSNWGQRVDLQGYGILVYSCGYGDLDSAGGPNHWYTKGFSGTSSASPIVTGSVLDVSGVFQHMLGIIPDADTIRNLLIATGSPQQGPSLSRHIGPRPDLRAALGALFDPVDSIEYGDVTGGVGENIAIPITLTNTHPLRDIYLPFVINSGIPMSLDSISLGPRTAYFEQISVPYDNRPTQVGYKLRADNGGGSPYLAPGSGVVAYLWVHATGSPGQVFAVDSAWLGSSTRLRLVSAFDDGYPDYFHRGSVTLVSLCNCSSHGDVNNDGTIDVGDVVKVIDIAFRGEPAAPTDPSCPRATRADYNCDGMIDVIDVIRAIDFAFRGGAPICNPCNP